MPTSMKKGQVRTVTRLRAKGCWRGLWSFMGGLLSRGLGGGAIWLWFPS